ncbi:hypothetical protein [Aminipila sp.]|uniref:hypothetical protein n=1 Tax=Aminipila sp. TaxID=2060095 RepID=UPI00289C8419|nr:hypothetical protein [Aminipila sp.]
MKQDYKHVPGNRTLMPYVVQILNENDGTLSYVQVVYMVMFKFNLPTKMLKKAYKELGFTGSYLRKIGALKPDSKKGIWSLQEDYMNLSFDEAKRITYDKYDISLGRK